MTYVQALTIALIQGATELFPVSSLGHSVLVPAWIGGSWQTLVTQSSQETGVALEHSFRVVEVMNHFAWADGCATDIPDRKERL